MMTSSTSANPLDSLSHLTRGEETGGKPEAARAMQSDYQQQHPQHPQHHQQQQQHIPQQQQPHLHRNSLDNSHQFHYPQYSQQPSYSAYPHPNQPQQNVNFPRTVYQNSPHPGQQQNGANSYRSNSISEGYSQNPLSLPSITAGGSHSNNNYNQIPMGSYQNLNSFSSPNHRPNSGAGTRTFTPYHPLPLINSINDRQSPIHNKILPPLGSNSAGNEISNPAWAPPNSHHNSPRLLNLHNPQMNSNTPAEQSGLSMSRMLNRPSANQAEAEFDQLQDDRVKTEEENFDRLDSSLNQSRDENPPARKRRSSSQQANKMPTVKRFICPHASCGRAFARNFNLQSHIKSHMGIRDFSCAYCMKKFSRKHDLGRHNIAMHGHDKETGEPPADASQLRAHMLPSATGEQVLPHQPAPQQQQQQHHQILPPITNQFQQQIPITQ